MGNVKLSVVVCTYNRSDLLRYCLQSLTEQTLNHAFYEVLIVDNNSTDATQDIASEFAARHPNFRVIVETTLGLSYARNRGWKEARGRYVAYIDDDAKAYPDWCERIVQGFEQHGEHTVAVGGQYIPWYEITPPKWFANEFETITFGDEAGFRSTPDARFGFGGANMAFRKDILEEYGGFHADYGMSGNKLKLGEETELFIRIYKDHPYFWYDPELRISHWVPKWKMKIAYRIRRSFKSGVTTAIILYGKEDRFFSKRNARRLYKALKYSFKVPGLLLKSRNTQQLVRSLQEISYIYGYTIGNM